VGELRPRTIYAFEVVSLWGVFDRSSEELTLRGFRFVGPTAATCRAAGMVNSHVAGCFRWAEVQDLARH
jgi:3-methyladenine DNA glycosylase Tag